MLEKLKKYKFVFFIALLFILFISIDNEVKASTNVSFEYDGVSYDVPVDFELENYCVLTNIPPQNGYFILLTTSNDTINIAIEGAWTLYFYNTIEYGGRCNDVSSYYYDSSSNTFIYGETGYTVWSGFLKGSLPLSCLVSNCDVYIIENENTTTSTANSAGYLYKKNIKLSEYFYVEYNENTCSYFVYTDWFSAYDLSKYAAFYSDTYKNIFNINSYDDDGWETMSTEIKNLDSEEPSDWRQYKELVDYGEYYFVLYNSETNEYNISKIVLSEDGESYISNYNTLVDDFDVVKNIENVTFNKYNIYVVYDSYSAIIYSSYFKYGDRYDYEICYSLDGLYYDFDLEIEEKDVSVDGEGYYRYYKEVTENRTYYFRLQIYDSENNGSLVDTQYFTIVVDGISTEIESNKTIAAYRNTTVYKYFKNSFGLLFYPIDVMIEFFDRLSQIQYTEPSFTVPSIKEPFTNVVLINEFTFNLNDVLEDNNILYIYNIYLMFVDFILYVTVFCFMYKVFKTFFNFGGGI